MLDFSNLKTYIKNNLEDPWKDTFLEGYVFLSPHQKGEFGELLVSEILSNSGMTVEKPKKTLLGYDRTINGIKTEIKFSVSLRDSKNPGKTKKNNFVVNHVSKDKDWERVIFLGMNDTDWLDNKFLFFTKEDFLKNVSSENSPFRVQQSGNNGLNDDYFVPSNKSQKFLECEWIYPMSKWDVI